MNSFLKLSTRQEFDQWVANASPDELAQLKAWEAANAKTIGEINAKAKVLNQGLNTDQHPVDLAQLYDAVVSHKAATNAKSKQHPLRDRFREIAAKEKAIDPRGYIKRASRLDEFKNIPQDTLKDWLK